MCITGGVDLRIPFITLIKVAFTALLILSIVKLWSVILMLLFAVLIAVMLDPVVVWLEDHGARRWAGISFVAVVSFGLLVAFLIYILPTVGAQLAQFAKAMPQITKRIPIAVPKALTAGMYALEGVTGVVFVLVVAMYLLVEGRRAYAWLISFWPPKQRQKVDDTMTQMRPVVLAFVRGNFITSFICAGYVLLVTSVMHLPMPLLLATIAFIADFVPVVGTIVMIAPAAVLAMTQSTSRTFLVIVLYLIYHLIENYVIIPRVYGSQMRLSTLTVLVAIAIGGTLQGVVGAVLALPLAAAYPIVERIWLRGHLPADTVPRHDAIEATSADSPQ